MSIYSITIVTGKGFSETFKIRSKTLKEARKSAQRLKRLDKWKGRTLVKLVKKPKLT